MKISAIVLTYNSEKLIEDCLESRCWGDVIIVVGVGATDKKNEKLENIG